MLRSNIAAHWSIRKIMFSKPLCPFCGAAFDTVDDVMHHLNHSACEPYPMGTHTDSDPESRHDVTAQESDDSHTASVEGAG